MFRSPLGVKMTLTIVYTITRYRIVSYYPVSTCIGIILFDNIGREQQLHKFSRAYCYPFLYGILLHHQVQQMLVYFYMQSIFEQLVYVSRLPSVVERGLTSSDTLKKDFRQTNRCEKHMGQKANVHGYRLLHLCNIFPFYKNSTETRPSLGRRL